MEITLATNKNEQIKTNLNYNNIYGLACYKAQTWPVSQDDYHEPGRIAFLSHTPQTALSHIVQNNLCYFPVKKRIHIKKELLGIMQSISTI